MAIVGDWLGGVEVPYATQVGIHCPTILNNHGPPRQSAAISAMIDPPWTITNSFPQVNYDIHYMIIPVAKIYPIDIEMWWSGQINKLQSCPSKLKVLH